MFLILGAAGQLGQAFRRLLGDDALPLDRAQADLANVDALDPLLERLRPRVVLNCAAYNQVDRAESDAVSAFTANTVGPARLARLCREGDILLVHFSTNYVFGLDAGRRTPYREDDLPGPQSVYAASKLAGEYLVQANAGRHLVVRTCGLFGTRGAGVPPVNFVATMLRLARAGKPLRVVSDQVCTPTAASDLAAATVALVNAGANGLFHVTNSGCCSWFDFARTIFSLGNVEADLQPIATAEYQAAALRPEYSVLDCGKALTAGAGPLRPWQEALDDYLKTA